MKSMISNKLIIAIFFFISLLLFNNLSAISTGDFNEDFSVTWSPDHVNTSADGRSRSMKLDRDSGSAMSSNNKFLFGAFDMKIKLIPGNSAGTVVAYYLTSDPNGVNHDELDFEFLGNKEGKPYVLQTNVYANGTGNREQRVGLWFDPTKDFHTYSIFWNFYQIVFMVDWVPIRTYRNHEDQKVAYPGWKPMWLTASIWDGSSWATDGGRAKVDWSKAPYVASFRDYKMDACPWNGTNEKDCRAITPSQWWNNGTANTLTWYQRRLYRWVKKTQITYDYCMDAKRFNNSLPPECSLPAY
ncbi:hypothetical protein DM860_003159 [Cuscuta australis]|uniref:Xyloglucan endotransglucosylase/hydrolase n=1 Tax=Cuscuta australis TaxID=267555 RepID=A0A328D2C5_9ASTE|nr:hypothetical protein DM860_003159 [Cuscuta australis]